MSKESEYREDAAESLGLANHASTTEQKDRLLRLAEKWLNLADYQMKRRRRARPKTQEHPLVRDKLGPQQPDVE